MTHGWLGRIGLLFLVLAGIGEVMAAFFDINHRLHGPAAMIGIPSLPIAAVLLTIALRRSGELVAGVDLSAQAGPMTALPAGVTPVVGWANRLPVAACMLWVVLTALPIRRHPPAS